MPAERVKEIRTMLRNGQSIRQAVLITVVPDSTYSPRG